GGLPPPPSFGRSPSPALLRDTGEEKAGASPPLPQAGEGNHPKGGGGGRAMIDAAASLFLLLQIFFVDLLLGADNAIVIALACSRLPPASARRALALGAAGAIALRLVLILFANTLLGVPLVKLLGAWTLIVIAFNVRAHEGVPAAISGREAGASDLVSAAAVIMLADGAMSLDNVVALAAIAGGNPWMLTIGVLASIPILVYGAFILSGVLRLAPELFTVGAAFLGWIAGGMAVTDPLVSGFVAANAPALNVFAPALSALFVLAAGKGTPQKRARAAPAATALRTAPAWSGRLRGAPKQALLAASAWPETIKDGSTPVAAAPAAVRSQACETGPAFAIDDVLPGFASDAPAARGSGWTEERLVVAGFVLLAVLAGLIIVVASVFDSLT
ncbi:MAG TPA: YjbE family putative metal transport protein, partial [Roseiarcus sp.]|nr:YjbE family putative metal transport protein [Roseiarcus sp.]